MQSSRPTVTVNPDGTKTIRMTLLKRLSLATGKPQYQIAASAGIHPSIFSQYVRGEKDITTGHLKALCTLFNLPSDQLVGWVSFTLDQSGEVVGQSDSQTV